MATFEIETPEGVNGFRCSFCGLKKFDMGVLTMNYPTLVQKRNCHILCKRCAKELSEVLSNFAKD